MYVGPSFLLLGLEACVLSTLLMLLAARASRFSLPAAFTLYLVTTTSAITALLAYARDGRDWGLPLGVALLGVAVLAVLAFRRNTPPQPPTVAERARARQEAEQGR